MREKRRNLLKSIEYKVELSKVLEVLKEAGRKFTRKEFTARCCNSCSGVSILAHPCCLACWKEKGFSIKKSEIHDSKGKSVGLGLFSLKNLPRDSEIGNYDGYRFF